MAEKSSQVAPTLHVSRSGKGKCAPVTNAPSIARTGQNDSSTPSRSAIFSSGVCAILKHGSHHAPSG